MGNQGSRNTTALDHRGLNHEASGQAADSFFMKKMIHGDEEFQFDIEVLIKNPMSFLFSVQSLEELNLKPNLLQGVKAMGLKNLTKIQQTVLPTLLFDSTQNIIVQSMFGQDLTVSFILVLLSRVDTSKNYPHALYVCSCSEEALQIRDVATKMARYCPEIKLICLALERAIDYANINGHIVIGTPIQIYEYCVKLSIFDLKKIEVFVLDSAEKDFKINKDMFSCMFKNENATCQSIFSINTPDKEAIEFVEGLVPDAIIFKPNEEQFLAQAKQYYVKCENIEDKFRTFDNIFASMSINKTVIFCNTNHVARQLLKRIPRDKQFVAAVVDGAYSSAFNKFNNYSLKILIITCEGVFTLKGVNMVINFDMPLDSVNSSNFSYCYSDDIVDPSLRCCVNSSDFYLRRLIFLKGIVINFVDSPEAITTCNKIESRYGKMQLLDLDNNIDELLNGSDVAFASSQKMKTKSGTNQKEPILNSIETFEGVPLKSNLARGCSMVLNTPSKIREALLPVLLADPPQNVIVQAISGSDLAAAFVLAMLSKVDSSNKYPQVLYLCNTYELATQIGLLATKMAQYCPEIKLKYAVRSEEIQRGTKITDHILIGTPKTILDWGIKFSLFDLSEIKIFVLDEAEIMFDRRELQKQCIRIYKDLCTTCQIILSFAACDIKLIESAETLAPSAVTIKLHDNFLLDNVKQYYVKCENADEKFKAISNIYTEISIRLAIIFCDTDEIARWLSEKMSVDGHSVAVLTGDLTDTQRVEVLDGAKAGDERVLITSGELSHRIDFEQINMIINFDMPIEGNDSSICDTYLRRIGLLGHCDMTGSVINLVDSPQAMAICTEIENHFGKKIQLLDVEDNE